MVFIKNEHGTKTDRRLHLPLIESGKKKLARRDANLARLVSLGMPEDAAKKALRG